MARAEVRAATEEVVAANPAALHACATPEPFCFFAHEAAPDRPLLLLFGGHLSNVPA